MARSEDSTIDLHSTRVLAKQEPGKRGGERCPPGTSPTSTTRHYCQGADGPAVGLLGPSHKTPPPPGNAEPSSFFSPLSPGEVIPSP
jgi:hypothetical protein